MLHLPGMHEGLILSVALNSAGTLLATGSINKSVKVVSVPSGKLVLHLPELHESMIHSVALNSTGTLLATGSLDKSVKVVSVPSGKLVLHLPGLHEDMITSVALNSAGTLLASGSTDQGCTLVSVSSAIEVGGWKLTRVLPPSHPARCPSVRQCLSLLATATEHANALASVRAEVLLCGAIRDFPELLARPSSASSVGLLAAVIQNNKTSNAVMDAVIAGLRLPDGAPRPIMLMPDAVTKQTPLRHALEFIPPDRRAVGALLGSASASFTGKFCFACKLAVPAASDALMDDVLYLAEEVPSCLDLLVDNLLATDGALTQLPPSRQLGEVRHDFELTGQLTEARAHAQDAVFRHFGGPSSDITMVKTKTSLALVSLPRLSQAPDDETGRRSLLAILLDENCVAAFETPVIRLLIEHQWKTFGHRYAVRDTGGFLITLLAPFMVFADYLTRIPHNTHFGDAATHFAAVAFVLCWPNLLHHSVLETRQLCRVGVARYISSLHNLVDCFMDGLSFCGRQDRNGPRLVAGCQVHCRSCDSARLPEDHFQGEFCLFYSSLGSFASVFIRADLACMSARTAAGLSEIRDAGADGDGLPRRPALLLGCAVHPHRRIRGHLHAAHRGRSRRVWALHRSGRQHRV